MYPTGNDTIDTGGLPIIPPKKGKSLDTGGLPILKKKEVGGVPSQVGGEVGTSVHQSEPDVHKLKNLSDLRGVSPQQQQEIKDYLVATDKEHKTKVNDAINTTTDFYKASTKFYTGKENEFQRDVPDEQKGEHAFNFLNNPNVIERTKTDPEFAKHYKEAKFNWRNDFPSAAQKHLREKIGNKLVADGKAGLFTVPSNAEIDKAAADVSDAQEMSIYKKDLKPNIGTLKELWKGQTIPTPDILHTALRAFDRGGGDLYEGARHFVDNITGGAISAVGEGADDRQKRILENEFSTPQVEPKGKAAKIVTGAVDMAAYMVPSILGSFAGAPVMGTLGAQFYGHNLVDGMKLFSDNKAKQEGYATLTTAIDLIAGEKLPIKGAGDAIKSILGDVESGAISKATGKERFLKFLTDTFHGTNALKVMEIGHRAAEDVFEGKKIDAGEYVKDAIKTYPEGAIPMAFFAGVHAALGGKGGTTETPKIEEPKLSDQDVIKKALDNDEIKGVNKGVAEAALQDPTIAKQLVEEVSAQVNNKVASHVGGDVEAATNMYGKTLVDHVKEEITPQETTTETVPDKYSLENIVKPNNKFTSVNGEVYEFKPYNKDQIVITRDGEHIGFIIPQDPAKWSDHLRNKLSFLPYAAGKVDTPTQKQTTTENVPKEKETKNEFIGVDEFNKMGYQIPSGLKDRGVVELMDLGNDKFDVKLTDGKILKDVLIHKTQNSEVIDNKSILGESGKTQISFGGKVKEVADYDFKQSAQIVRDNLEAGETGYVKLPSGEIYEISRSNKTAKLLPKETTATGKPTAEEPSSQVMELQAKRQQLINQRDNPPTRNVIETNDEGEVTGKVIQKPLKQKDIESHVAERNKEIEVVDAQIEKTKLAEKTKPKLDDLPFLKEGDFDKAKDSFHMDELAGKQKAVKQKFKNLRKISECIWAI